MPLVGHGLPPALRYQFLTLHARPFQTRAARDTAKFPVWSQQIADGFARRLAGGGGRAPLSLRTRAPGRPWASKRLLEPVARARPLTLIIFPEIRNKEAKCFCLKTLSSRIAYHTVCQPQDNLKLFQITFQTLENHEKGVISCVCHAVHFSCGLAI